MKHMYSSLINLNFAFPLSPFLKYYSLNICKPLIVQMLWLIAAYFSIAISLTKC